MAQIPTLTPKEFENRFKCDQDNRKNRLNTLKKPELTQLCVLYKKESCLGKVRADTVENICKEPSMVLIPSALDFKIFEHNFKDCFGGIMHDEGPNNGGDNGDKSKKLPIIETFVCPNQSCNATFVNGDKFCGKCSHNVICCGVSILSRMSPACRECGSTSKPKGTLVATNSGYSGGNSTEGFSFSTNEAGDLVLRSKSNPANTFASLVAKIKQNAFVKAKDFIVSPSDLEAYKRDTEAGFFFGMSRFVEARSLAFPEMAADSIKYLSKLLEFRFQGKSMSSIENFDTRLRTEAALGSQNLADPTKWAGYMYLLNNYDASDVSAAPAEGQLPCKFFNTKTGCKKGNQCDFLHAPLMKRARTEA